MRLNEGELGLILMGGTMLSKSLVHFSFDGKSCVPSLLLDLRPNYVEVIKITVTSFKRSHEGTAALKHGVFINSFETHPKTDEKKTE